MSDYISQIQTAQQKIKNLQKSSQNIQDKEKQSDDIVGKGLDYLEAGVYGKQTTDLVGQGFQKVSDKGLAHLKGVVNSKSQISNLSKQTRGTEVKEVKPVKIEPLPEVSQSYVDKLVDRTPDDYKPKEDIFKPKKSGKYQLPEDSGAGVGTARPPISSEWDDIRSMPVGLENEGKTVWDTLEIEDPKSTEVAKGAWDTIKEGAGQVKSAIGDVGDYIGEKTGYTVAKKAIGEGVEGVTEALGKKLVESGVGEGALEGLATAGSLVSGVGEVAALGAAAYGTYELGKEGVHDFESWWDRKYHHQNGGLTDQEKLDQNQKQAQEQQYKISQANIGLETSQQAGTALQSRQIQQPIQQSATTVH